MGLQQTTLAHLDSQVAAALILRSSHEYYHWLRYTQYVLSPGNASTRRSRSRTGRSLSRYFHSRGTSTLAVLPLLRYPSPTSRHPLSGDSTTGLGECPLTHYCLYTQYPLLRGTSSLARYPPLLQYTPLLWLRHWLLYAQYVLSYSTASTHHSRSRTWHSLSRYFHSRGTSTLAVPLPHLEAPPFLR